MTMEDSTIPGYVAWFYYNTILIRNKAPMALAKPFNKLYNCKNSKVYKVFLEIEKLCKDNKYDLYDYIFTAIMSSGKPLSLVVPKDLLELEDYRYVDYFSIIFKQEVSLLNSLVGLVGVVYPDLDSALRDPKQPFTAWFRLLHAEKLDNILRRVYGKAFKSELSDDPKLWNHLLQLESKGYNITNLKEIKDNYGSSTEQYL